MRVLPEGDRGDRASSLSLKTSRGDVVGGSPPHLKGTQRLHGWL